MDKAGLESHTVVGVNGSSPELPGPTTSDSTNVVDSRWSYIYSPQRAACLPVCLSVCLSVLKVALGKQNKK
jgi:hypothetical protein